jgi:hypothetical protein
MGVTPAKDAHVAWLSGCWASQTRSPGRRRWGRALPPRSHLGLDAGGAGPELAVEADCCEWRSLRSRRARRRPRPRRRRGRTLVPAAVGRPPALVLDAEDIWLLPGESATSWASESTGRRSFCWASWGAPLASTRGSRSALEDSEPTSSLALTTRQAYEFLREIRPVLMEQGFGVRSRRGGTLPMARLGARLRLESGRSAAGVRPTGEQRRTPQGRSSGWALVKYRWEIAVGDTTLTLNEFEQLASRKKQPLVRVNGRWVEIRPEDVQAAIRFIRENPGGEMRLGRSAAPGVRDPICARPVSRRRAGGHRVARGRSQPPRQAGKASVRSRPPATFQGTLRPYQVRGVSWMSFLGVGWALACASPTTWAWARRSSCWRCWRYEREQAERTLPRERRFGRDARASPPAAPKVAPDAAGRADVGGRQLDP